MEEKQSRKGNKEREKIKNIMMITKGELVDLKEEDANGGRTVVLRRTTGKKTGKLQSFTHRPYLLRVSNAKRGTKDRGSVCHADRTPGGSVGTS